MTDREVLLIAYGALKADGPANVAKFVEAHLFPPAQDKPSEPAPSASIEIIAPTNWPNRSGSSATYAGEHVNNCTTPVQREPGTPGVDRPLKRSDVLK